MTRFPLIAATLVLGAASLPDAAVASAVGALPAARTAFATVAVTDGELASVTGRAFTDRAARTRLLSDQNSQSFLQQVGQDNRIAMDNWWGQTGAALIADNLLLRP